MPIPQTIQVLKHTKDSTALHNTGKAIDQKVALIEKLRHKLSATRCKD